MKNARQGLNQLNFTQENMRTIEDATYQEFDQEIKLAYNTIRENWARQETTAYFVYYAGHGVMQNNLTLAVTS